MKILLALLVSLPLISCVSTNEIHEKDLWKVVKYTETKRSVK
jgi:hypothetical protein